MRKKGRGGSYRSVICYHNSNPINTKIVILETNKTIFFLEAQVDLAVAAHRLLEVDQPYVALRLSHLKYQNQPDHSLQLSCICCTVILLCSPHFSFCPFMNFMFFP